MRNILENIAIGFAAIIIGLGRILIFLTLIGVCVIPFVWAIPNVIEGNNWGYLGFVPAILIIAYAIGEGS